MSAPDSTTQRICPKCGSPNSRLSLFCAECGATLNGSGSTAAPETMTANETASHAPVAPDPQQTQPFTSQTPEPKEPVSPWALNGSASRWSSESEATRYADPVPATATSAPVANEPGRTAQSGAPSSTWATATQEATPAFAEDQGEYAADEESLRGFFLGVLAFVLILAVAAIYAWTVTPDGSFRDSIQGWLNDIT